MKKANKIIFKFEDNTRLDAYNESCTMEKRWFGEVDEGQIIDLETYYNYCKEFAAALGFAEKSINEWFGEY